MNQNGHALLTLAEAATYLRVHPRTMSRLLQERQVPGVKIGRQWRVRRADLDAYFTAATSTATRNAPAQPSDSASDGQEPVA
jgi:excisionase family DNA binding protein